MPRWGPALAGWCLGIALWDRLPAWVAAVAALALGLIAWVPVGRAHPGKPWAIGLCAVGLAAGWTHWRMPVPAAQDPSRWAPMRWVVLHGRIASDPVPTKAGWRCELAVEGFDQPFVSPAAGTVLAAGSGSVPVSYGQRVQLEGALHRPSRAMNPGEAGFDQVLARRGIFARLHVVAVKQRQSGGVSAMGLAIALRHACTRELESWLPPERAALMGSLLLGAGASPVPQETSEAFRVVGLAHILAVSGAQVHLLLVALRAVLLRLGWRRRPVAIAAGGVVLVYVVVSGASASVVRAGVMAGVTLLVWVARRQARGPAPLAVAAGAMLVVQPTWWWDLGFHFSVLATFALLHTSPLLAERFRGVPGPLARALADPLAALLWVLPLELMMFGQLSAWSLPANLVSAWFVEGLTLGGAVLLPLAGLVHGVGWLAGPVRAGFWVAGWGLEGLVRIVQGFGVLPGAQWYLPLLPSWLGLVLYGLVAAGVVALGRRRPGWALGCLVAGVGLVAMASWPREHRLEVVVLSIGQGDAIVLHTPRGRWVLIDAGPNWAGGDAGEAVIVPYLHHRGVNRLDAMVLTHAHADHLGGMAGVLAHLPVGEVWESGQPSADPAMNHFFAQLLTRSVPWRAVHEGLTAELEPDLELSVLNPMVPPFLRTRSDPNNNSVALRLRYRDFRMILAADLESLAERALVARWGDALRADILKVPHHGSRYGSTPEFLAAIRPKAALISVGERNTFHHPWPGVVERLEAYGPVLRTDRDGALTVTSDGHAWEVAGFASGRSGRGSGVI